MIIFIHGEDTLRSRQKLNELVEEFKKKRDTQGLNVIRLDGADIAFERFRHEALSQGFLAPKRMVIIADLLSCAKKEVVDQIAAFLQERADISTQEGNVIVFWETHAQGKGMVSGKKKRVSGKKTRSRSVKVVKGALYDLLCAQEYVFHFPPLDERGVREWARAYAKKQGATIEPPALEHLLEIAGNDLWRLERELAKLTALRKDQAITLRDAEEAGEEEAAPTGFAFTDAIAARRLPEALRALQELAAAGVEPLLVHGMLVRAFRTLALVKSYQEDARAASAEAAQQLGLHPFVVKKTVPHTARFSWEALRKVYSRLLALDFNLKRQGDDPYLPLELFVMNLDTLT